MQSMGHQFLYIQTGEISAVDELDAPVSTNMLSHFISAAYVS